MLYFIKAIYDEAYKESHLSGLQAVWDAAVAHAKAAAVVVEQVVDNVVESVESVETAVEDVVHRVGFDVTEEHLEAPVADAPAEPAAITEAAVTESTDPAHD